MGKQKIKKTIFITFLLIFAATLIYPLLTKQQKIYADNLESVSDRAYSWSVLSLIAEDHCRLNEEIKTDTVAILMDDGMKDGEGGFGDGGGIDQREPIGHHVKEENGKVSCVSFFNEWLTPALDMWGYNENGKTYVDWLTSLGYSLQGDTYRRNGDLDKQKLRNSVPSSFFLPNNTKKDHADSDVLYEIYSENFRMGCKASYYKPFSDMGNDPNKSKIIEFNNNGDMRSGTKDGDGKWYYKIWSVNKDTKKVDEIIYKAEDPKEGVAMGYGTGISADTECDHIAYKLSINKTWADAWAQANTNATGDPTNNGEGGGGSGENKLDSTCDGLNALGWILCPVIKLMDGVINTGTDMVIDLLTIDKNDYGYGSPINGVKTAWSAIRILSTITLVGIALFVIISQMLGFEFLSAYTLKKMIPKMAIGVILMQLSWVLIVAAIAIVDVIGLAISSLITLPFGIPGEINNIGAILDRANISGVSQSTATVGIIGGAIVGIGALGGFFAGISIIAITIAVAVVVAIATLVLRKMIIIALMIIAPLAIIAWMLPNTEKYWKMWWSNLTKLLLMFPLIMGFLAVGRAFAWIVAQPQNTQYSGRGSEVIRFLIILLAFYLPFFLIPMTFKWGGSLMTMASGSISKFGSKIGAGLKNTKAIQNMRASRDYNRQQRGLNLLSRYSNTPQSRGGGVLRAFGRHQAGTSGYYGRKASQARTEERNAALQAAEQEMLADFRDVGVNGYDAENTYMEALAHGDNNVNIDGQDFAIRRPSSSKRAAATKYLIDRDQNDAIRRVWNTLDADMQASVDATHGAKRAAVANDTTGRPSWNLGEEQIAGQGDGTIRNFAAEWQALATSVNADDIRHSNTMLTEAHRTLNNPDVHLTPAKREQLEWMVGAAHAMVNGDPVPDKPNYDLDCNGRHDGSDRIHPREQGIEIDPVTGGTAHYIRR
jgi:hypothetical protein